MNGTVTVFVPCDVVPVRVEYALGEGLSPMEEGVLRAVVDKFDTIGELNALLGLGERLTLDIVSDLWRRSYLTLDFTKGTMCPSADVRKAVQDNDLSQLQGAERGNEVRQVMVEKLTGFVLPAKDGTRKVRDGRLIVQVGSDDGWADDLSGADVARALDEEEGKRGNADDESGLTRRRRVVSAYRVPARLGAGQEQRWLPLDVRVSIDPDTEDLQITVAPGPALPADRRDGAARRIKRYIEEFPDSEFARHLRGRGDAQYEDPRPVEELLDRLERRVAKARTEPAGTRTAFHSDLAAEARVVHELVRHRIRSEVRARLVVGEADHLATTLELIKDARKQIVLASPDIRRYSLQRLIEPLREALEQGVQVAIVWGFQRDSKLDDWVKNVLADLRRGSDDTGTHPRLVWSSLPSRTNARLVIADDRRALVTGAALLDGPIGDGQLGVDLGAVAGTAECEPIEALLRGMVRAMPEYRLSQALLVRSSEFRPPDPNDPEPEELAVPQPPHDREGGEVADSAVLAWANTWSNVVHALRGMLTQRAAPWAEVIEDGEHSAALWRVLRSSQKRVMIGSRQLAAQVVTLRFVDAVRAQLDRGTRVDLWYQRSGEGDQAGPLHELGRDGGSLIRVERMSRAPRVLATDQECIVTSFDLLALNSRPDRGVRQPFRSELGVRIVGADQAAQVLDLFDGRQRQPELVTPVRQPAKRSSPDIPWASGGQGLLNQLAGEPDESRRVDQVFAAVAASARPLDLLNELASVHPGEAVLRSAAAALVRHDGVTDAERVPWLKHLTLDQWRHGAFVGAAVLRRAVPDPDWQPAPWLCAVAAAHRTRWSPQTVYDNVTDGLSAGENAALVSVAATDLVLGPIDGETTGGLASMLPEALELLPDPGAPWDELARAATEYWQRFSAPVPIDEIMRATDHARADEEVARMWSQLLTRHTHAARTSFDFANGLRLHGRLFHADGVFGEIQTLAERRDVAGLRAWLAEHAGQDASDLIDEASAEALPRGGSVHSRRRRNYEQRLDAIIAAAQRVDELAQTRRHAEEAGWVEDVKPLAAALAQLQPALDQAAAAAGEPERRLIVAALNALKPLARWGEK
ncbi:hypothetical protein [Amycolatopsis sp. CA-128772]|uniref:hypothetical protein n=1 Tax=Amycolatopsis sp. CA-128772 TaxID=2073159 RepID=UPI000CD2ADC1|nr:hypothetical protein [Amycolatopsis sp. CA-128772]